MCIHYWIIDKRNQGQCKLCGKHKNFQLENKRVFKYADGNFRSDITGEYIFGKAEYYMHGSIPSEYKKSFQRMLDKIWPLW